MTAVDTPLELTAEPVGKTKHKITLMIDGKAVFVDTVNVAVVAARTKFLDTITAKFAGIDREQLDTELLRLAATRGELVTRDDHGQEVDVSRVVRPELFHTPHVSGITLPTHLDAGGKLVTKWRTYLRWADGRREATDAPDRLTLPSGEVLYVRPDSGDPPTSDVPAWAALSRRAWLGGAAAPDPGAVFRGVCEKVAEYLDFPPDVAPGTTATLALWTVLSYAYPAWDAVPYLNIGGPMGSGKSRLLDVLQRLVFRPTASANLTAPVLFRTLHANGGTMLFDEAERLRQSTPEQQEIQSIFLTGYRRGGNATRLEPVGDGFRPVRFDVFGPKALACISGLPPTLASRCIPITMFRSAIDSPKPKLRLDADPTGWQALRDELHMIALENGAKWVKLASRADVVPPGIGGRSYELWQPLLALAEWFQERGADKLLGLVQRHAVASVAGARDDAVPEADEVLLEVLAEAVRDRRELTSGELLSAAKLRDEVTFRVWHPKTVTARLKSYGIAVPAKVCGVRRYRNVAAAQMRQIQQRYGIELGML